MSYLQETEYLGSLDTFNPDAFSGNVNCPQNLCDFILALGVASNDLRDIFQMRHLLKEERDANEHTLKHTALSGGMNVGLLRLQAGVIHELLKLIKENRSVLDLPIFHKIYRQMDKNSKSSWDRLVDAATENPPPDSLGKALVIFRNKVGFHYDAKQIGDGFRFKFLEETSEMPVLSRGNTMRARRFYFADASVEQYILRRADTKEVEQFLQGGGRLIEDVNRALYDVITGFITCRGFPWREYRQPNPKPHVHSEG